MSRPSEGWPAGERTVSSTFGTDLQKSPNTKRSAVTDELDERHPHVDEQIVAGPRPTVVGRSRAASDRAAASAAALEAYHAHRGAVYGFAMSLARDQSVAEDLLQEAFCRLVDQLTNRE